MTQRLDEWKNLNSRRLQYHQKQWSKPYRSTVKFAEFIKDELSQSKSVIDLACGTGSATHYLALNFKMVNFLGLDIAEDHIEFAQSVLQQNHLSNLSFDYDDWFNLTQRENVDGVISLQTLLGLPEWQEPLRQIITKTDCNWMAFSSLFYPGEISCKIEVTEHKENASYFYNVYAIPQIEAFAKQYGFELTRFERFAIDIDLPKPEDPDYMGTYTTRIVSEISKMKRLQISGPLLMNWGFIMLKRINK